MWFGEHLFHTHSVYQTFCFALDPMSHGTVLLDMVGPGRHAVGVRTTTRQLVWKIRGRIRGRMVLLGKLPQISIHQKISVLEKDAGLKVQRRAYIAGRRVLEKELERHSVTLNGPKNTAKHIEAKQNWINMESKRVEAESCGDAGKHREFGKKLSEWLTKKSRNSERTCCVRASRWTRTGVTSCPPRAWRKYETSNNKN